jgi:hypothetical protein
VIALPLTLLPGTEMYALKNSNGIVERPISEFQIPHVISSPTTTKQIQVADKSVLVDSPYLDQKSMKGFYLLNTKTSKVLNRTKSHFIHTI